jgi:PAS domain S-box-containing protein
MITQQAAHCLVEAAAKAMRGSPETFHEVLDDLPAPIYSTDGQGTLTYFNKACITLAGRTPRVGIDKWCVTWRIYRTDGEYLPHDACPMAIAIRESRSIRGVEAIAERPDGTRINFIPYPTPLFDEAGNLAGAVNLLLDITDQRRTEDQAIAPVRARAAALRTADIETLARMAARIAGRDPDQHVRIKFGEVVAFDDLVWRYPDFLLRGEAAYRLLESIELPE